jgi:membrane associated rhomboid family serine protease
MAFIPVSDNPGTRRRRFPFVNYALISANIAVYVYGILLPGNGGSCLAAAYSVIPSTILHGQSVGPAFFAHYDGITGCAYGQPTPVFLTLITAMFLHANFLHIAGNMIFLWVFGDNVEDRLGHIPYLLFYLFCGLVAGVAQIAATVYAGGNLNQLNLGASGAIAGALGAYLVFFPGSRVKTLIFIGFFITIATLNAVIVIGLWFVLQLFDALVSLNPQYVQSGGVAYFAHVGGFVAGLLIALLVRLFGKAPAPVSYPRYPAHRDSRGG